jgi:hypothetical protein
LRLRCCLDPSVESVISVTSLRDELPTLDIMTVDLRAAAMNGSGSAGFRAMPSLALPGHEAFFKSRRLYD